MKICLNQLLKLLGRNSLVVFFLGISFIFANNFNHEFFSNIRNSFSYINAPVTFSVNISQIPTGEVKYPSKYKQGYNELDILGENQRTLKKIPFYLDIKVLLPVLLEQKEKGIILSESDLVLDWKNIKEYNQQILLNEFDFIGKELKFYKKKNDVLYRFDIKEPDVIKRQDKCTIKSKVGSVLVTMPGVSLKNGSIGSTIKVLNEGTGKIIDAKVIDSKNVEVLIN